MNNCFVKCLKAEVNNPELPVFHIINVKNYVKTTEDNQYVDLSTILNYFSNVPTSAQFRYLAFDIELAVSDITVQNSGAGLCTRKSILGASVSYNTLSVGSLTQTNDTKQSLEITNNTLYTAKYKSKRDSGAATYTVITEINGTSQTSTNKLSTGIAASGIDHIYAFASVISNSLVSKAGVIKIKSITIYAYNDITYTKVAELVPANVDGVNCLYDKLNEVEYLPNTGILAVE